MYLLTDEDDFNALAAVILRGSVEGPVHRLGAPADSHGVVAPYIGGEVLFGPDLTWPAFSRRYEEGAAVLGQPAGDAVPPGSDLLFLVRRDGRLDPVTEGSTPLPRPGTRSSCWPRARGVPTARRSRTTSAVGRPKLHSKHRGPSLCALEGDSAACWPPCHPASAPKRGLPSCRW